MRHEEGSFSGAHATDIHYQCWLPGDAPKASLLIVHGLAEHCGRYMSVIDHFVPRGYAVYGVDHIGHGKSAGPRVFVEQFDDFISVLRSYICMIRDWQPHTPLFMVGHSLGALIGAVYLLDHPADVTGAILSGPLVKIPENVSPLTLLLSRLLSRVLPRLGIAAVDATGVSRDPEVVQAYIDDPLVYTGKTTARLGCEMLKAIQRVTAEASAITTPLLVLQGSADRLVPPDGAEMLHRLSSSADKTLKLYEGLHHEIYNEPERNVVLADVEAWLQERMVPAV
jgi:alpha-beta hydrolase superfamily lysophospholipase